MSQPPPPPPDEPSKQQPVPPTRSRKGLIIGLVAAAVAQVLLVCGGVSYFVVRSIPNPAPPRAHTSASPSHSPSKAPAARIYSKTLEAPRFRLRVEIEPAKTGDNVVHLY